MKYELIIEAKNCVLKEKEISEIANIKYRLPSIDAYVIEVDECRLPCISRVVGEQKMYASSCVSF